MCKGHKVEKKNEKNVFLVLLPDFLYRPFQGELIPNKCKPRNTTLWNTNTSQVCSVANVGREASFQLSQGVHTDVTISLFLYRSYFRAVLRLFSDVPPPPPMVSVSGSQVLPLPLCWHRFCLAAGWIHNIDTTTPTIQSPSYIAEENKQSLSWYICLHSLSLLFCCTLRLCPRQDVV